MIQQKKRSPLSSTQKSVATASSTLDKDNPDTQPKHETSQSARQNYHKSDLNSSNKSDGTSISQKVL